MKKWILYWKHYWLALILGTLFLFGAGYFVCEFAYNRLTAEYVYYFQTTESDVSYLKTEDFFTAVFEQIDAHNKQIEEGVESGSVVSYAKIDYPKMLSSSQLVLQEDGYAYCVPMRFFPSTVKMSNGMVNEGKTRFENYFTLVLSYANEPVFFQNTALVHYQNPWLIASMTALFSPLFFIIGFVLSSKSPLKEVYGANNQTVFSTPFHKKYWQAAAGVYRRVKNLSVISVLFALMLICKLIPIPSGFGSLGLGFTYLVFAVLCMLYGPLCGLVIGFLSDTIGFFITQSSPVFFFGYTLNAMLSGLVYGLCLYKTKISFFKCFLARLFVNLLINAFLGSLWWAILYDLNQEALQAYFLLTALPKNVLYLLPQSILLYLVIKALRFPLCRFGLLDEEIAQNISLF